MDKYCKFRAERINTIKMVTLLKALYRIMIFNAHQNSNGNLQCRGTNSENFLNYNSTSYQMNLRKKKLTLDQNLYNTLRKI